MAGRSSCQPETIVPDGRMDACRSAHHLAEGGKGAYCTGGQSRTVTSMNNNLLGRSHTGVGARSA